MQHLSANGRKQELNSSIVSALMLCKSGMLKHGSGFGIVREHIYISLAVVAIFCASWEQLIGDAACG